MTLLAIISNTEYTTENNGLTEGRVTNFYNEIARECSEDTNQNLPLAEDFDSARKLLEEQFNFKVVPEVICKEVDGLMRRAVEQNLTWYGVAQSGEKLEIRPLLILDTEYLVQVSINGVPHTLNISKYCFSLGGLVALPRILLSRTVLKVEYIRY